MPLDTERASRTADGNGVDAGARRGAADERGGSNIWLVFVLVVFYTVSFLDRQILAMLVEPIQADLGISDFRIGLLQGFAFALFYAAFGLPLGWVVDRWSRRGVIFGGILVWSVATMACGLAKDFTTLFLCRLMVGAGEAALLPATYSLLSDRVRHDRLAFVLSIFAIGAPIGASSSLLLGGWMVDTVPAGGLDLPVVGHLAMWRIVLIVASLPGVLLMWLALTLPEPKRAPQARGEARWSQVFAQLGCERRFYIGHMLGFGLLSLSSYGINLWLPTYLLRRFEMTMTEAGAALSIVFLIPVLAGSIMCGWLIDRWFRAGRRDAHLRFFALVAPVQMVVVIAAMAAPSAWLCLTLVGLALLVTSFTGAAGAALQMMTPAPFRGRMTALFLCVLNLIGLGCGAPMVAALTDFVFHDPKMLGWSIATVWVITVPLACVCLFWSAPRMHARLSAAD